ncbi:predicted protein [Histoplasma mississippiense (nom. inval.)]|uniref:predicted protein n=1 Tax=Ajellomyces capsulatus (strain NAm1 / WU24) TaxID=2059318 RepID=UPI000157B62F|nr:predicted protein [Histoplasma mississippiense (nom. inval.)]EDN02448.1 predicted protein [Histoplasma mississippiense (nom. inval.)]
MSLDYRSSALQLATQYTTFLELAFPDAASFDVEKWALQADKQRLELFRKVKRYNLNQKIFDKPNGDQGWRYPKPDQYLAFALIESSLRFAKTAATVTMKVDGQKRLEQKHPFRKIYMEYGVAFKSCLICKQKLQSLNDVSLPLLLKLLRTNWLEFMYYTDKFKF